LLYTGGVWQMSRADTGAPVTLTGSGTAGSPFVGDGLSIVVTGTPQAGDRLLIQPTRGAVTGMSVVLTQPEKIAAAAQFITTAASTNTGGATINTGQITNAAGWTRGNYTLSFPFNGTDDWQAKDASGNVVAHGLTGTFASGTPIVFNGTTVTVTGTPAAGDSFQLQDNSNGTGDNRNALQIAALLDKPVLAGGTISLSDTVGRLVGTIGVQTNQAQSGRDAQKVVMDDTNSAQTNVSGVNLDEEAANLVRYQQAYQAAAKVISVANSLFQSLLDATR
jgi:flagellar hook-associated protein 1 FlgK